MVKWPVKTRPPWTLQASSPSSMSAPTSSACSSVTDSSQALLLQSLREGKLPLQISLSTTQKCLAAMWNNNFSSLSFGHFLHFFIFFNFFNFFSTKIPTFFNFLFSFVCSTVFRLFVKLFVELFVELFWLLLTTFEDIPTFSNSFNYVKKKQKTVLQIF